MSSEFVREDETAKHGCESTRLVDEAKEGVDCILVAEKVDNVSTLEAHLSKEVHSMVAMSWTFDQKMKYCFVC